MGKDKDNGKELNGRDSDSRSHRSSSRQRDRRDDVQKSESVRETERGTRYINGSKDFVNGLSASSSSAALSNDQNAKKDTKREASALTRNQKATFEGGDDFIPFEQESEAGFLWRGEKDEKGKGKEETSFSRRKGKERDTGIEDGEVSDSSRRHRSNRTPERERDRRNRNSHHEDDRRRERKDDDRNRGSKRKYDEYEGDDRYRSKRQKLEDKKYPWLSRSNLEGCRNVAEILHCEVNAFVDWISPTPAEDEVRGLLVEQITRVIKSSFPDAQVHPFGSYQTKLYLPTGDIDLVVLSNIIERNDKTTVLQLLARTFKRSGITSTVTIIAKARVPIIKFTSTHGRFKVDISLNQGSGLHAGKIINGFLNNMIPSTEGKQSKTLRSLIMITKALLVDRSLNEVYTGGLGSYSIVCLAVSFLQMHPKVRRGEIDPEKNLGVLLIEFFELYANHFNYDDVGISLRDGGTYFDKRIRGWDVDFKRNMLCIEDPADSSNDISSGSYHFHKVKAAFRGAFEILTTTAYSLAPLLRSRSRLHREDLSLLSALISVKQETIDHRRSVQKLYDRRVLHDIVKPQIKTVPDNEADHLPSSSSKADNSRAVESAWAAAPSDGSDHEAYSSNRRRRSPGHDDERGRYDIGRQPSKKRRRTERSRDRPTLYVADEDDARSENGREDEEREEHDVSRIREDRSFRTSNGDRGKKRDYWLAKAKVIGGAANDP